MMRSVQVRSGSVEGEAFSRLAQRLPLLCWLADRHGQLRWVNDRWSDVTGMPPEALLDDGWLAALDPASANAFRARLRGAGETCAVFDIELGVMHHDGERRPLRLRIAPLDDEGSRYWSGIELPAPPSGDALEAASEVCGTRLREPDLVGRNRTFLLELGELLRQESDPRGTLARSSEAIGRLFDSRYVIYGEMEPDDQLLRVEHCWSDGAPLRTGFWPLALMGDKIVARYRRGEALAVDDVLSDVRVGKDLRESFLSMGIGAYLTVPLVKGGRFCAAISVQQRAAFKWSAEDVELVREAAERTWSALEQARAETRLRSSEALLAAFMQYSPVGMYVKDRSGRYLLANPEMSKVFGRPASEVLGKTASELLGPEQAEMIDNYDRSVFETGTSCQVEEFLPDRDKYSWSLVVRFPILADGEVDRVAGFDIDMTDIKRIEQRLQQSREALYQTEKLTALGSLLAGVSHELNNPISILTTQAMLMEEMAEGTELAGRAAKIKRAAERCARIVQTFLAMARQKKPERRPVDVNEVLRAALDITEYTLRTAGIRVVQQLDRGVSQISADPDQLHQVLINLLVNAQHALEEQPGERIVTVRTRRGVGTVSFEVEDNGPGIPPDVRPRIFEPFFTTKAQGVGTGLGLSFSMGLIEAHGGTLELVEGTGSGACFKVTLPVGQAVRAPAEEAQEGPGGGGRSGRALVVDDEPDLAEALCIYLQRDGYAVDIAHNGVQAQACIRSRDYDLIISDLRMPELDGAGLYAWIESNYPALVNRIGFVTGDTLGNVANHFLQSVDCPVIEKPFTPRSVRAIVAEVGRRRLTAASV
jgi:PAS domain S-box-containing protein